jgi:phosphatidate phosphatase APP1
MRQRMMIRMLGGVMQATPDQMSGELFQARITPFMAEAEHKQVILVTINGKTYRLKKRTRRNGHFFNWINIPSADIDQSSLNDKQVIDFTVSIEGQSDKPAQGKIFLFRPNGLSVVSDIDDTIKDSSVENRRELLTNTFLREFKSIDGMANTYRTWESRGASFHYVSSSPWQLFQSLQKMHSEHDFPLGTMHLRNFRLRDQLLKKVAIRRKGKATAIGQLMKNMPERDFVLVGDSGEKDAKIYLKMSRRFPGRVKGVFIRDLAHRPIDSEIREKLEESLRPSNGIFATFNTGAELQEKAQQLFES